MMTNRQLFQQYLAQTSDTPLMLEIVRANGVYMYGPNDEEYIDLISGISVSNLGHTHPAVVEAVKRQAETYMHLMVYGEYVQSPQVALAKEITETLPKTLSSVYFVNSGSEAVEGALKVAKKFTGRKKIISAINAYHGSSHGALAVGGDESLKAGYGPFLPHVYHIPFGEESALHEIDEDTACIIMETIQGEAGVQIPHSGYWQEVRKRCDKTGTLLISDEIQTGFGRTGTFWGFESYDIVPDIIVSAKGMGSGMPIGAFISSKEIMNVITNNPILGHITTFGGHPVSAAGALAGIRTLKKEKIIESVREKGDLFNESLKDLNGVKEIRHQGLLMAVEFESYDILKPIIDKGIEKGVITDWFLFNDRSMRIAPPLIITEEEILKAVEIIKEATRSV